MTSLILNRLVWKDCRELMPLFLAGCLAFVATIAATCFSWSGTQEFKNLGPIVKLISPLNMFVNVCGLVAGILLFAPEKESRTSQFLGNLPVAPRSIATSKLLLGMACVFLFVTFCYFCVAVTGMIYGKAFFYLGWPPRQEIISNLFVPVMCFAWGVFWSLTLRSTLFALVAATASVLIAESLANFFVPELFSFPSSSPAISVITWVVRIPLLAVVIALVVRAVPDWLQDEPVKTFQISWPKISRVHRPITMKVSPRGVMAVLVWQTFQQSRVMLIVGAVACGMIAVIGLFQISPEVFAILALVSYAIPLCAASLAFAPDQTRHHYRFFQQQAEYGRRLWFSRLLPTAVLVVLATVCLTFGFDALSVAQSSSYSSFFDRSGYYIGEYNLPLVEGAILHLTPIKVMLILLTGMSIGQFFSMLVSSPILSVVCALLYGTLGIGWAFLMLVCDATLWLFLLPAALILFLTTWVQAPRWLADKKTVFDRWYPWLSLLFAAFLVMSGFAVKRSVRSCKIAERWRGQQGVVYGAL